MTFGDFLASAVIDFKFTSRRASGVPYTLGGTPAISVYKANGATQSTAGVTLTADFDSVTGLNHVRIDTSADGTFYAAGEQFQVVITTGTVDGVSVVGEVLGYFTLRQQAIADNIVDYVWDEVLSGAAHNVANSAGRRLRQLSALAMVDSSVNDASATTTSFVTALTEATTSFYSDALLIFTSGALTGQARPIISYNGTTKVVTFDEPFSAAPANADTFTIQSTHIHPISDISTAVWAANPTQVQKNTALANFEFLMTDDTNHDPATGLTVTVQRSIDGGAFAAATNAASEVASGIYKINLAAADLNGDVITLKFTATGADTRFVTIVTQP